ncbi:MAG TPA: glycosyltransferase [Vicinamibacterales bacterium]|nr:glycosyltransferase [Vicinamibacterales bacterium]
MTAIREIELSRPLAPLEDLGAADRCMVVIRWRGQVVGRAYLAVSGGRIPLETLEPEAIGSAGTEAMSRWLDEVLEHDDRARLTTRPLACTVAICTRDRPQDLERTLHAVTAQRHDGFDVLVVDNAPASEATRRVVERFPKARYVREPRPGLNVARNRALHESCADIVAFTDDDAAPEPDWLGALVRNFGDRRVACTTGLTLPRELETRAQELFEQHCTFVRGFKRRVFDEETHNPLAAGPVGAGANMAVRREIALALGGFDERLDAGMPTRSGGDHEMFVRLMTNGYQIVYDPAAVSWHRHRRTEGELLDTVYGYGVGVYAMWTKLLVERWELGVLRLASQWFRLGQLPALLGREPGDSRAARRLALAQLRGCLRGPFAWFAARRLRSAEAKRARSDTARESRRDPPAPDVSSAPRGQPGSADLRTGASDITVSVVVPTFNRRDSLTRLLQSLGRSRTAAASRLEVIVVDDGSSDGTLEVVRRGGWPFSLHVLTQQRRGAAVARNAGARVATGDVLLFLDDDVEPAPGLVEAHAELHGGARNVVGLGDLPSVISDPTFFGVMLRRWWDGMQLPVRRPGHRHTFRDLLSGHFSIRRVQFEQLGGFDEALRCREDYELGYRCIEAGLEFRFVAGATGWHHESTTIAKAFRRKLDEGRADVQLLARHPGIGGALPLGIRELQSRKQRLMQSLAWRSPLVGDSVARALSLLLPPLHGLRLRYKWADVLELLLAYYYWRAVATSVGTRNRLEAMLDVPTATPPPPPLAIDLADGLTSAAELLDRHGPASARLFFGTALVADVPHSPGAERLRGRHLRPWLARYRREYIAARAAAGAVPAMLERVVQLEPGNRDGNRDVVAA